MLLASPCLGTRCSSTALHSKNARARSPATQWSPCSGASAIPRSGRLALARFAFHALLDDPRFEWLEWKEQAFDAFTLHLIGASKELEPARFAWGP